MPEQLPSQDPLVNRFFMSPAEKADKEKGKAIVKAFYTQNAQNDGLQFFKQRNARQIELLQWAKGSQNMKEFMDFMSVSDANKAYVNIDTTQQRLAPQFVGTLVESMAKNKTYPCVKAIDDGSVAEKEQRQLEALFRMKEVATINDLQQQAGIQLEPDNVFVPDDELSARVHFELEDRLPKEIRFEELLAQVQKEIQFDRVLNRKGLFDMVVLNIEATMIEKIGKGKYLPRKCVPTNCIYNFFMNDTGDYEVTMFGEFYNLKVKDFRAKFGKSETNPDGLTEQQIFELAKLSTTKNNGKFNFMWDNQWSNTAFNITQNRPYDDASILILDSRIACGEDVYYVSKPDAFGKENIQMKKGVPYAPQIKKDGTIIEQIKPEDVKIIKGQKSSWMRGVYAPYGDKMLFWGAPDLIISPYTDTSKQLADFTINIPNNDGEYVPSLFERALEPLREYSITKLKRKQLIAQLRPSGIRIDVESARNIDLGAGDSIGWEEVLRVFNQTGTEVWSSKGLDPLQQQAPAITNTAVDTAVQKIVELTNVLAGIVNEIRQLLGVPQYRDGSDVGDRTSGVLQKQQNESSYNVTDFVLNGHNQLWEETFYKICLLHWNDIVKEEPESKDDMLNTRFEVSVKMKATEYEKQRLEDDIQRYSAVPDANGNPSLTPKDAFMLREIEDTTLAMWYLTHTYEENRKKAMEEKDRITKATADAQNLSLQQNAENEQKIQAAKLDAEKEMLDFKSTKDKELELLKGYLVVAAKDETGNLIKTFLPAIQQLVPNIAMPLSVENDDMEKGLQAKAQEEQMEAQQQTQGQPPMQPQAQQPIPQQQPQAA